MRDNSPSSGSVSRISTARGMLIEFELACASYERALEIRPGDEAATQLLERCRGYLENPPPADWTGVLKLTSK